MSDSASYTQVTGELDLIDRREILRTWQNVCIGISCSQCQFYNDDAMSGDCLLERWVHSLPSAEPEKVLVAEVTLTEDQIQDAVDKAVEKIRTEMEEPEIIRCKDCKFYTPMNRETKTGICNLTTHQNFGDNWFCAGAERRTDE